MAKQLLMVLIVLSTFQIESNNLYAYNSNNQIQRVRIDFTSSTGYTRHLLLGFTPNNAASDNYDYGYDAPNIEDHPDDLNWLIDSERYIIQGVGSFDENKTYPFGMYLENEGTVEISLNTLENFSTEVNVFIYDAENNIHHNINDGSLFMNLPSNTFEHRFHITFSSSAIPEQLGIVENNIQPIKTYYSKNNSTINIEGSNSNAIKGLKCFSMTGQEIISVNNINSNSYHIRLNSSPSYIILHIRTEKGIEVKKMIIPT